jgi:hypothetical protein
VETGQRHASSLAAGTVKDQFTLLAQTVS